MELTRMNLFILLILVCYQQSNSLYSTPLSRCIELKSHQNIVLRTSNNVHLPLSPRASTVTAMSDDSSESEAAPNYSQRQILKEETEAPFRKLRIFSYFGIIAGAGIGSLVSLSGAIAAVVKGNPLDDIVVNLGINVSLIVIMGLLWRRDLENQGQLLARIQKGGQLAGLKLKLMDPQGALVVKLSDLRRGRGIEKRVVVIAAPKELLKSSLESAVKQSTGLSNNDILIVPLEIERQSDGGYSLAAPSLTQFQNNLSFNSEGEASSSGTMSSSAAVMDILAAPMGIVSWNDCIKSELSNAVKQQPGALDKGVTLIIKKNGKVGTRRFGVPIWGNIIDDVEARENLGLDVTNV